MLGVLAGCMRIYPDPELPDVRVEWFEDDCRPGTGNIAMALIAVETDARIEVTVPCANLAASFVDVPRELYRFEARLLYGDGEAFSRSDAEVDLRDGFDEEVSLYFGGFSNLRVAWAFDMGATCQSLGATGMELTFSFPDATLAFATLVPCELTPHFGSYPDGVYTLRLRALAGGTTVASSTESDEFEIIDPELTDLGEATLSP